MSSMLLVTLLGLGSGGGCHAQSDWFEQQQQETKKRFQQFDKDFEDRVREGQEWMDNRQKQWDKKSSFNRRNEWEEETEIFMNDNGLIYKIVVGGIAAFFVLLLIV